MARGLDQDPGRCFRGWEWDGSLPGYVVIYDIIELSHFNENHNKNVINILLIFNI